MIDVKIPSTLAIPDAEICALLSNGLENAIHAVAELEKPYRYGVFYCELKQGKLLIEIKNPYTGCINFKNGLPTSEEPGHGYGCQSIRAITEQHHGICTFQTENNIFLLRIVLPMQEL